MSATVTKSDQPCFMCKSTAVTFFAKLKDKSFAGYICAKHLHEALSDREEKQPARLQAVAVPK